MLKDHFSTLFMGSTLILRRTLECLSMSLQMDRGFDISHPLQNASVTYEEPVDVSLQLSRWLSDTLIYCENLRSHCHAVMKRSGKGIRVS